MDRGLIWEKISILKEVKGRLLNVCEPSLEPQIIFLEIHKAKEILIGLADDWNLEGNYIEGHSTLSKIINVFLPNARESLTRKEIGKFGTHIYESVNELDRIIKKLEEKFPKEKIGFKP